MRGFFLSCTLLRALYKVIHQKGEKQEGVTKKNSANHRQIRKYQKLIDNSEFPIIAGFHAFFVLLYYYTRWIVQHKGRECNIKKWKIETSLDRNYKFFRELTLCGGFQYHTCSIFTAKSSQRVQYSILRNIWIQVTNQIIRVWHSALKFFLTSDIIISRRS